MFTSITNGMKKIFVIIFISSLLILPLTVSAVLPQTQGIVDECLEKKDKCLKDVEAGTPAYKKCMDEYSKCLEAKGAFEEIPPESSAGEKVVAKKEEGLVNLLRSDTFEALIRDIAKIITKIGIPLAVFFIILVGFQFVTAQGNEEKIRKAKENFQWVIIGTAIIVGARILVEVLIKTLGEL